MRKDPLSPGSRCEVSMLFSFSELPTPALSDAFSLFFYADLSISFPPSQTLIRQHLGQAQRMRVGVGVGVKFAANWKLHSWPDFRWPGQRRIVKGASGFFGMAAIKASRGFDFDGLR